ncbi:MAG: helix-turn-helix transcriptional regulator [Lachnospiraceae bacterium]|jgi:transcriptional regulator with XRE-family HTH domain|nr:helix-turn-helix transcriptional regulator [Lachnospiraceae bacterium]
MVDFGNTLKSLRLQNNMTQAQLSQKLGLTKSVISAYETGLRLPSYDVLIHISQIFHVTTDYLLGVEQKQNVDFSGLTEEEISAVLQLIKAMKRSRSAVNLSGCHVSDIT